MRKMREWIVLNEKKSGRSGALAFVMLVVTTAFFGIGLEPDVVYAGVYENNETGYEAIINDEADILTASEEQKLLGEMEALTEYTNIAFVSVEENYSSTENLAKRLNEQYFGDDNGILLIVDMDNRYIWIDSMGSVRKTITTDYAQSITDNVYSYASDRDYYKCASKAFEQIYRLLEGQWIAQPMKYISNALLAVAIALFINYFIVRMTSRANKASSRQIMGGIFTKVDIQNARANFTHQTKRYSPQSSGSASGSRSGRSGGSGGGGHSGGGHRF